MLNIAPSGQGMAGWGFIKGKNMREAEKKAAHLNTQGGCTLGVGSTPAEIAIAIAITTLQVKLWR